jgi:hypothetical protein
VTTRYRHQPTRSPPAPLESAEQASFVAWFEYQFPKILIIASLNGAFLFGDGERRALQGARLKKQGMKKGVPDLQVPEWRLWIEMKRLVGGRLSDDQILVHEHLRGFGDTVLVTEGAAAAMRLTQAFVAARVRETSRLLQASGQA